MGAWEFLVATLEPVAAGLLLIVLGWAASVRASVHRQLERLRRDSDGSADGRAEDPFSVFDQGQKEPDRETDRTKHLQGVESWRREWHHH